MALGFLKLIIPQDKKFFVLFDKAAVNLQEAAKVMYSLVTTNNKEDRQHYIREIERLEHVGDDITHEIFDAFKRTKDIEISYPHTKILFEKDKENR